MSLDVYLISPGKTESGTGIFVRENGATREISRAEWDARFPGCEPATANVDHGGYVFERNITHNLNMMADAAGIYYALWRPRELMDAEKFGQLRALEKVERSDWYDEYRKIEDTLPIIHASDLIGRLCDGLAMLKADPARFRAMNPSSGWGNYEGLVEFVEKYLEACKAYPHAEVRVSR